MNKEQNLRLKLLRAENVLESGISSGTPRKVKRALLLYDRLHDTLQDPEELDNLLDNLVSSQTYLSIINENVVRACSFMCLSEPWKALDYMKIAESFLPEHVVVLNNLGFLYHKAGQFSSSIRYYERCLELYPTYETAYKGILDVLRQLRLIDLELTYAQKGTEHCCTSADLFSSLGLALLNNNEKLSVVRTCFERALALNPPNEVKTKILVNLGHVSGIGGDFKLATSHYLDAISCIRDPCSDRSGYDNMLLNLFYFRKVDDMVLRRIMDYFISDNNFTQLSMANLILKIHKRITSIMFPDMISTMLTENIPLPWMNSKSGRRVVIGFVSADFVGHAVSHFIEPILQEYDQQKLGVILYANAVYSPNDIEKLRCDAYRCILNTDAQNGVNLIKSDKVDILIDLSGHTCGNRLDIFAQKPTTVCLSYLGYPGNCGLPFVRRISDDYTERFDDTCRVHRLPTCFLRYALSTDEIAYESRVREQGTPFTFGCFAKLQKINAEVVDTFIAILKRLPQSRLVLKSRYFKCEELSRTWREKFHGVANRVLLLKGQETHADHLRMFHLIDVHLDTFPYSGTTITCNALLMNVPVVTWAPNVSGTRHVQLVSASILNQIKCPELIAYTLEQYVELAVNLATGFETTREMDVRSKFLEHMVKDTSSFTRHFEDMMTNLS